jgi:fructose-bisphosphate aldolase class II
MASQARKIFEKSRRNKYAIGAFNAGTFESIKAIINVAARLKSPAIIEASPGETSYLGLDALSAIVRALARQAKAQILLNLDHAKDPTLVLQAARLGFDLVHYDGSLLTPEENKKNLLRIVPIAHRAGSLVEAEREHIMGSSTIYDKKIAQGAPGELTDPAVAREFARSIGFDILAVSVGEAHGMYQGGKNIDAKLIKKIHTAVPTYLSLHGGSGIPANQIRSAVKAGITKINVNTEIRLAYSSTLRRSLASSNSIVPYEILPPVIKAIEQVVERKIKIFGSAGKA